MTDLKEKNSKLPIRNIFYRILVCTLILSVGIFGMAKLVGSKKPPAEVKKEERVLQVKAMRVQPADVPVVITGYGEVRPRKTVIISPEVSGKIVEVHPRLDLGEVIPKGETLFQIDTRNYDSAAKKAKSSILQWKSTVKRIEKQFVLDQQRLKTLERNRYLTELEFKRFQKLYQQDNVGTRSGVEKAEKALNNAIDQVDRMSQALALYPIQIKEAQSRLASAEADLAIADANLKRCTVSVDFDARLKSVSIERGQYVAPGRNALILVDDAILEIFVPLDSRDARKWLKFKSNLNQNGSVWFNGLEPVTCFIRWTEEIDNHIWKGHLHRVVTFNHQTRTLTVAVRVKASDLDGNRAGRLPLVEGMFCAVDIPGKTLQNVYSLPSWAVSYKNTVFIAYENRLKTIPVKVARVEGDTTIVSDGLNSGDLVITTRLVDPLENVLLKVTKTDNNEEKL